jgi:N utilization substance protein B
VSELGAQRHRARERALELLYEAAAKGRAASVIVTELRVPPDAYTQTLLGSVTDHQDQALELISASSFDWPIERMAMLDRLILTLATCEMLMADAPPTAVILDEAVELAKTYSTDGSPSFVNGVLSSIAEVVHQS